MKTVHQLGLIQFLSSDPFKIIMKVAQNYIINVMLLYGLDIIILFIL